MGEKRLTWTEKQCHVCGRKINSWDLRLDKALAYKNLTCERCVAKEYDMEAEALRDYMENFFGMRPCVGL